jgi:hypothetical protein
VARNAKPLTHATVNGLRVLRGDEPNIDEGWRRACDNKPDWSYTIASEQIRKKIPTCPKCAVMRDAALEGKEVTP